MDPNDYDENNDVEKEESFGTGSFTTNTFNARLASSNGMAILKYVQSEDFGKHGESIKLISNIQVRPLNFPVFHNFVFLCCSGIHEQASIRK